jgi:RNA polymerase sigma factor (sigma-70 family)
VSSKSEYSGAARAVIAKPDGAEIRHVANGIQKDLALGKPHRVLFLAIESVFPRDTVAVSFRGMANVEDAILKNLQVFVAFARKRLGNEDLAEDVVQDSLIKALTADRQPETEEETIKWFYRILRRSIIDVYRKEGARGRALERFEKEFPDSPSEQDERALCECLFRLMPRVPEQYRELLEQVDLQGIELDEVAVKLGVTRNNLTVRLHRARKHLRKALSDNCRACAVHGCLDCSCDESSEEAHCN